MNNPGTLASRGTQDTRRTQTNIKTNKNKTIITQNKTENQNDEQHKPH
jgi:hypothetical protein